MRKINITILFCLLSINLAAQTKIFSDLDFENNKYELYILKEGAVVIDINTAEANPRYSSFIVKKQSEVKAMMDTWVGEKTYSMSLCGYDYTIYVISGNEIVESVNYNSECGQAVSRNGIIDVTTNPFENLDKSNAFSVYQFRSESIIKSRKFLEKASSMDKVFIPQRHYYQWQDFEGEFHLTIKDLKNKKDEATNNSIGIYELAIRKKYPEDKYKIRLGYINSNTYDDQRIKYDYNCYIYCGRDFFDKFNLYKKYGWREFDDFDVYIFGENDKIEEIKSISDTENVE